MFFMAGLALGVSGLVGVLYGVLADHYPATLTASVVVAVGFVTAACAAVSAEDAMDEDYADDRTDSV